MHALVLAPALLFLPVTDVTQAPNDATLAQRIKQLDDRAASMKGNWAA